MRLLVSFIMATVIRAKACPVTCECNDFSRDPLQNDNVYTTVTCKNNALNVTNDIPITTNRLIIRDFPRPKVEIFLQNFANNLSRFPVLFHLSFVHCSISDLSRIRLSGLDKLESLDLSRNELKHLLNPDAVFNLTSLKALDLSTNKIQVIESYQFQTLRSLEVLNLSANIIETFGENSFVGLSKLLSLDISGNKLRKIQSNNFKPLLMLQYLNLSNNQLQVLDEAGLGNLQRLQQLDVSWNRLTRVTPGSLQLPSLSRLLLTGNPALGKSNEPTLLVGPGKRLQIVDASQTGLTQVPAALTQSVRTLRLAKNAIRFVNCGHLDSYPLLQLLDFTSNNLEEIEDDALGRLDSLSILYLSDNKLRSIPHRLPERLKILHLQHNQIGKIFRGDLQGMQVLEILLLKDNEITAIQDGAFNQLKALTTLDLSQNSINVLPTGTLSELWQLRVLRLSNINVTAPAKDMAFPLTTPEHLVTLDLSNSPGLAQQFLADTAVLAASKELQELNLSGGKIQNIRSDLLHYLPQLKILHLHNNSLECANLEWLANWMRIQNRSEFSNVTCLTPEKLSRHLLSDVQNATQKFEIHRNNVENETVTSEHNNTDAEKIFDNSSGDYFTAGPALEATQFTKTAIQKKTSIKDTAINKNNDETLIKPRVELYQRLSSTKSAYQKNIRPSTGNGFPDERQHHESTIATKLFLVSKGGLFLNKTSVAQITDTVKLSKASGARVFADENIKAGKDWENSSITTGKIFMFTEPKMWHNFGLPGLLMLTTGILIVTIALTILAFKFKRDFRDFHRHDIEETSLPSVTDLW